MATLVHGPSGARCVLGDRVLVGRSSACQLRLTAATASGEHATVAWTGGGWVVRDLSSRNGTFVDGERVVPGVETPLHVGAVLSFGDEGGWRLDSADPPAARASSVRGEVVGTAELLVLPSEDAPECVVYQTESGRWRAADAESEAEVQGGDVVRTEGGVAWTLALPTALAGTVERDVVALSGSTLVFGVSTDEEHVELRVRTPHGVVDLGARSCNHVLLALARARLEDAADGIAPRAQGWRYSDEVQRMLCIDRTTLNVAVHRARRHLAACGVRGGGGIVERRPGTLQLRLAEVPVAIEPV